MKTGKQKKSFTLLISIALIGLLLLANGNIFGQTDQNQKSTLRSPTKIELANYQKGLNSDNEGLRKSCIYFAGKYKMTEFVDILKEQLSEEKDPETSLLIVYALYQILEKGVISGIDSDNYFKTKYATLYE